jgi:hypothetical protein
MSSSPTAFSLKRRPNLGQKERENFRIKSMLFSSEVRENRRYLITKLKICQEFCGEEGFSERAFRWKDRPVDGSFQKRSAWAKGK